MAKLGRICPIGHFMLIWSRIDQVGKIWAQKMLNEQNLYPNFDQIEYKISKMKKYYANR